MQKLRCRGAKFAARDAFLTVSPFRATVRRSQLLFFGHYWLDPKSVKAPLAPNVACLDYSTGYGGPLVAYRFDGEKNLNPDKFVAVE